jgi:threonine aldolase
MLQLHTGRIRAATARYCKRLVGSRVSRRASVGMQPSRSFASDNNAPIAPEILQAIADANEGDAIGYGDDPWTQRAQDRFRKAFGPDTLVFFTFNGTGANVAALSTVLRPWEAVLCPQTAHLQTDECGAFERFSGSKVIPVATARGKLRPLDLEPYLRAGHGVHFPQPRAISISQPTEFGEIYQPGEIAELCDYAHGHGLFVHVDGARIANAAAALGRSPREITVELGVDCLSFGGTKNGLMLGEAVCFFSGEAHAVAAAFVQKQAMQLASKMRYIAAQFDALLENDRWLHYASHSNAMARSLHQQIRDIAGVRVTRSVDCNAIFAVLQRDAIERLQREFFFYVFDEGPPEVRWMTHWATTKNDVDRFATAVRTACAAR